jgi:hypothetical protein
MHFSLSGLRPAALRTDYPFRPCSAHDDGGGGPARSSYCCWLVAIMNILLLLHWSQRRFVSFRQGWRQSAAAAFRFPVPLLLLSCTRVLDGRGRRRRRKLSSTLCICPVRSALRPSESGHEMQDAILLPHQPTCLPLRPKRVR